MNTHADKTQKDKSQSVSAENSQMQRSGESSVQFVDNRPEAVAQWKLQEMANNSPQAKQAIQLRVMADTHSAKQQQPIQRESKGIVNNQKIVQRAAADLAIVVGKMDPVPANYDFVDNGQFITVNGILNATESYLMKMVESQKVAFRRLLDCTHHVNNGVDLKHEAYKDIKNFHASSNERLRFRQHLGTPGVVGNESALDKFIKTSIIPVWGSPLPVWISEMDLHGRNRLYDLANSGREEKDHKLTLTWARTQNPTNISELANYTEYYMASKDQLKSDINKVALEKFDARKGAIVVDETDVPARAQQVANSAGVTAETKRLSLIYNPIKGRGFQNKLTAQDRADLSTIGITSTDYNLATGKDKTSLGTEIGNRVNLTVTTFALNVAAVSPAHQKEARTQIKIELEKNLMATAMVEAKAEEDPKVASKFSAERKEAIDTEYAGAKGPQADGSFWTLDFPTQVGAIKAAAASKLPFFSEHAAAYHALKHYGDIEKTEDRAENTGKSKNESYYASATKTVANPTEEVTSSPGQLNAHPAFFFYRTVPKDTNVAKSQDVRMWAIVVVSDTGNVRLATYFQKPKEESSNKKSKKGKSQTK